MWLAVLEAGVEAGLVVAPESEEERIRAVASVRSAVSWQTRGMLGSPSLWADSETRSSVY